MATAWFLSVVIFEKARAGSNEQRARSRLTPLQQMPRADVSGSLPSCCLPPFSQLSAVSLFSYVLTVRPDGGSTASHYVLQQSARLAAGQLLLKHTHFSPLLSQA